MGGSSRVTEVGMILRTWSVSSFGTVNVSLFRSYAMKVWVVQVSFDCIPRECPPGGTKTRIPASAPLCGSGAPQYFTIDPVAAPGGSRIEGNSIMWALSPRKI